MMNICYLSKLIPNKTKVFKIENLSIENKKTLILSNLEPGRRLYINVLAQNLKTKELITFQTTEIFTGGGRRFWWRLFRNLFIIGLVIALIIFINKYRKAREELIFLKGEAVAKTEREMSGYSGYDSEAIKYSTLGSGD